MSDESENKWHPTVQNLKWFSQVQKMPDNTYRKRYLLSKSSLDKGLPNQPSALGFGRYTRRGPERIIHAFAASINGPNCIVPYPIPEEWVKEDENDGVKWTEWMDFEEVYVPASNEDDGSGLGIPEIDLE